MEDRPWRERLRAFLAQPAVWIGLALAVAALEYSVGQHVNVRPLSLVPLAIAAWFGRVRWAITIAVVLALLRLSYYVVGLWEPPRQLSDEVLSAVVRVATLATLAVLIKRTRKAGDLQREVSMLRGLLPICMYCKRIQDADDQWQPVEQYIGARTDAAFTHRVCPACIGTHRRVFLG